MKGAIIHSLRGNSKIEFGDNVLIAENVRLIIDSELYVGAYTRIAMETLVIDSDFHYILNVNKKEVSFIRMPIYLGEYNWIGNKSVIKKGVKTPNYTIISNGSMVTKDFSDIPEYSLLVGSPAKLFATGLRRVYSYNSTQILEDYFSNYNHKKFAVEIPEDDVHGDDFCNGLIDVTIH